MKAFRIFFKNIGEAFKSVGRNAALSLASISCITITLILVGISLVLSYNVKNFTSEIEKDMTIAVFVDREATEEVSSKVKEQIESLSNISEITFESKNEVKEQMMAESEVFNNIMSEYTEENNPLQDTYLIKVKDIELIGETAEEIKKIEGIAIVKYGEGMVEELIKIFDIINKITYVVVIGLVLVTAFLISNTIKITIANRKRQIEIMRLVGASNTYIKLPFFFEGIILGFIGSVLPILICCFGYVYLYDRLGGQLFTAVIKLVNPDNLIFSMIALILAIGIGVGAFGSYRAVRRYLKI